MVSETHLLLLDPRDETCRLEADDLEMLEKWS